jgi:hypothetical protein
MKTALSGQYLFFGLFLIFAQFEILGQSSEDIRLRRRRVLLEKSRKKAIERMKKIKKDSRFDSFYDPKFNYSKFEARVTDRDDTGAIFKLSAGFRNVKFFRSGDQFYFRLKSRRGKDCSATIRSVEKGYFIAYVKEISSCTKRGEIMRRGTLLSCESEVLAKRVREASLFRLVLLNRRKNFFSQLNDMNHFIWSFDQEKMQAVAKYDRKIVLLEQEKEKAIEDLYTKKKDSIRLQRELAKKIDELDRDLSYYQVEKDEARKNRWRLDHDSGVPVGKRPSEIKYREF